MFRSFLKSLSKSKSKPTTLAIVAIAVSLSIFTLVQYKSLSDLENKTVGATNENLRQITQIIALQTGDEVRNLAVKTLHGLEIKEFNTENLAKLESKFSEIRRTTPAVKNLFAIPKCPCQSAEKALFSTPQETKLIQPEQFQTDSDIDVTLNNYSHSEHSRISTDVKNDLVFWTDSGVKRGGFQVYVFYPQAGQKKGESPGFIGFTLDRTFLKENLLREIITKAIGTNSEIEVAIIDDGGNQIYGDKNELDKFEINQAVLPFFPNWNLAIGYKNTTIKDLARNSFLRSLSLSLFAVALLVVGVIFILRAISREMKLAEAKSNFVSNVSHELKTPLSLIRLFAETLELGRVTDSAKSLEYYRIINSESRRLTQLIDNILDFSQMESGRKTYQFTEADINEVIEDVLNTYQPHLSNLGFKLTTKIQNSLPPINIDRHAITQVILNLLSNAVKYSKDVKEISVSTEVKDHNILIKIKDHGIGIAENEQKKIFEMFYRADNQQVHDTKGSGLGLALTKHIITAHHGKIQVESKLGKGSQFTIFLPVETEDLSLKTLNYQEEVN